MHRIDTRMYISRRDVFRKGAKPFRNCFPSPPRGKSGNLLILDTSHWFTSVTRLVQTILSLSLSRLNYFPRSSLYLYEYLTPSPPFFNLSTYPFLLPFEIIWGRAKQKKKEKFCCWETRGKDRTRVRFLVWIFRAPGRNEAVENYYCARWCWVV